ncbi:MAG: TolC family protein [Treponema sp.]|nr:TolC family protein [Treponema sp.]
MKKLFAVYLLFLSIFCFAQQGSGNQPSAASQLTADSLPKSPIIPITPDKAVEMAIENNLSLQQTILTNEAKRRAGQTPWNVFIPTIELSGTLGRLNKAPEEVVLDFRPIVPEPIIMGGGSQWRLSGSLSLSLTLNIGTFVGMKQTIEEYQAGKITIERAKLQLERDVRKAYYQLLLIKEQVTLLQGSYENANRQVAMAQANYRGGLIPEVNLLQVQVARENLKPQIDEAENGYRMAMASFAMFLGLPYDAEFELAPIPDNAEFIVLEAQDLISRAASNKPEVEELRRNLAALKAQRTTVFFNLYTPSLIFGFNMDPTFGKDPMKDSWFNGDYWNQQTGMFRITLAWRLNAFIPFTREYQQYQAMNDAVKAMELGMSQVVQGTEMEVYNIIMQLEKTRTTAEAQRMTVNLAARTLQLSETAYRNGLKTYLEVQNDELALRQARLGTLQQNYTYLMSLLDLEYAIGVPFGTLSGRK